VAGLADRWVRSSKGRCGPNGLRVERVRVPLGVHRHHLRDRPNATSDAAGLCLKAGNATMLRGSSSAVRSMSHRVCLRLGAGKAGLPEDVVVLVEDTRREAAVEFMQLEGVIDCLIPGAGRHSSPPSGNRRRSLV